MVDPPRAPGRLRRLASGWSLRASLGLVALAALVLGWVELRVGPQRRAARAILRAGGWLRYDWHYDGPVAGGAYDPSAGPPAPGWLVQWLGEDYFGDVVAVSMEGGGVDGPLLAEIGRLTALQSLDLSNARLGRSDLAHIAGLAGLRDLSLRRCNVDDEALAAIAALRGLETLSLSNTPIRGPGLSHLAGMPDLQQLYASWTSIDDRGLRHLPALPRLGVLTLDGTRITDAGLPHLRSLPGLVKLDLARVAVSDAGLKSFESMPGLRLLALSDYGQAPHPTPAGVDALRRARPDLNVDYYESTPPSTPGRGVVGGEPGEGPQGPAE